MILKVFELGRGRYEEPKKRFARNLIKAVKEKKLEKNVEYKINRFHEVTGTHSGTIGGHLARDLTNEEVKEKGEVVPILEINLELKKQGSPLVLRKVITKTQTREVGGILYGCEYGPLKIVRWPIIPRQAAWGITRPTLMRDRIDLMRDRIDWLLNNPIFLF